MLWCISGGVLSSYIAGGGKHTFAELSAFPESIKSLMCGTPGDLKSFTLH